MIKNSIIVVALMISSIFFAVGVYADEDLIKATDIVRRSSEMFEYALRAIKPEAVVAKFRIYTKISYGFASESADEPSNFFALGVTIADTEAALSSGSVEKSLLALNSLERIIKEFNAQPSFTASVQALRSAIHQEISPSVVGKAGLQVLMPFLEELSEKKGMKHYFRLGEWTEAMKLVLMIAREEENSTFAGNFLKEFNYADHFLSMMRTEQLSPPVINALKELKNIGESKEIGDTELRKSLKALDTIIELMG